MTIRRITRLRDFGIFRDFSWPSDLPDFGRYNLIYGWNGSGKTTLSRLFRDLELRRQPSLGMATLRINGHDVAGQDFPNTTLPIRVFNRDLVNESIFPVGGGDMPPIFVVGRESVEKQKEIERLKQALAEAQSEFMVEQSRLREAEKDLDRYCQDRARLIKNILLSSGQNRYNNYNKTDFREQALAMIRSQDAAKHRLNDAEREALVMVHRGTPKPPIDEVSLKLPDLNELADVVTRLLEKTVVTKTIQALKEDVEVADWVNRGLSLHKHRGSKRCLFCEQPLPEGRIRALEAHFSELYQQFMAEIEGQLTRLNEVRRSIASLSLPRPAEFYDDLVAEYESAEYALRSDLRDVAAFADSLVALLEEKRSKPFDVLRREVQVPTIRRNIVDALNAVIRKHNDATLAFEERVRDARDRLARDLIAADLDEFQRLAETVQAVRKQVTILGEQCNTLWEEIRKLESEIVEFRRPAEELNEDLKRYLGHGELQLVAKDTGYQILRNGEPAHTLSEGEMTAIALLYFLKSLEGRDFDLSNGVVVLDDPVSSLDANAMYLAFSLIRERTQNTKQLFVLTHNFSFFKEVRRWLCNLQRHGSKDQRSVQFYMLTCVNRNGSRTSLLRELDRLLKKYESEYHYLFATVYRFVNQSSLDGFEAAYGMPNVARRLLEGFLSFRAPGFENMWTALKEVAPTDELRRSRLYQFVQAHSHYQVVGQPEHDPSILGESREILRNLLEIIQLVDPDHYEKMVRLIPS